MHAASWRLVLGTGGGDDGVSAAPARGHVNMAVDEALLRSVQRGGAPALRFYTWQPACLSLGRNQPARHIYDAVRAAAAGIDIVRRPTGGLAVLHDRELTYCVVAPLAPFGGARAAYRAINAALVEGLRCFGVAAAQAPGVRTRGPLLETADPCFQAPAPGEVVARGRKLAGSAQRCERGVVLQHGSILLSGSQARVLDLLCEPAFRPAAPTGFITLEELLGREPDIWQLAAAMCRGFERMFGTRLAPAPLDPDENATVEELAGRYRGGEWTWRR
ncbi:MAG: lipoate--protein ligase family protein [Longimicrobiales bacterium]